MDIKLNSNEMKTLLFIRENEKVSRQEIASYLKVPLPTIVKIVERLIKEDLVIEEGYGASTGGRRPVLLSFNHDAFYSVGIALGRTDIKIALTNLNGEILQIKRTEICLEGDLDTIFEFIVSSFFEILSETKVDQSKILGAGVGLPGPIKNEKGVITTPNLFKGEPIPIIPKLNELLKLPVMVEKDANVAALAEKWFDQGRKRSNFIYVYSDVGVGCGLIINKQLYRGEFGEAGGLGHTTIDIFGDQCSCGNYGCVETLVSTSKIEENIRKKLKLSYDEAYYYDGENIESITFEKIIKAHNRGSAIAKYELKKAGKYLGVAVANVVTFINPELVILGGPLGSESIVVDEVKRTLFCKVLGSKGKVVPIEASNIKEGVVLGAATLAIERIFTMFSLE